MPRNATAGAIAVYQDVSGVTKVTLSPQLTGLRVSKVPLDGTAGLGTPGLTVFLPASPSDGDSYTVSDVDGSASVQNVIIVFPDPNDGTTVDQTGAFPLAQPFASATFTFDAGGDDDGDGPGNWTVSLDGTAAFVQSARFVSTANQSPAASPVSQVVPDDLSPPAGATLFAVLEPLSSFAPYRLSFELTYTLSAADTVSVEIDTQTRVTAFAGGTSISGSGGFGQAETMRYEKGSAVTTAGDAPAAYAIIRRQLTAAGVDTISWSDLVTLPAPPAPSDLPTAVLVKLTTAGGANMTGMALTASWQPA